MLVHLLEFQNNDIVPLTGVAIPIHLIKNFRFIDKHYPNSGEISEEETNKRFDQYRYIIPQLFNKYLEEMDKISRISIEDHIKEIRLFVAARDSSSPFINSGYNINPDRPSDTVIMFLGIEDPHYALVYMFHELLHTILPYSEGGGYQTKNHRVIEFFTDYKLFKATAEEPKINSIFLNEDDLSTFRKWNDVYDNSNMNILQFRDLILKR